MKQLIVILFCAFSGVAVAHYRPPPLVVLVHYFVSLVAFGSLCLAIGREQGEQIKAKKGATRQ